MNQPSSRLPVSSVVAHRGWPVRFPENSMAGFREAVSQGARWLETDIQVADDGTAWLFHDVSLQQLCNVEGTVFQCRAEGGGMFGHQPHPSVTQSHACATPFPPEPLARLAQLAELLLAHPDSECFWELKPESIERHGLPQVLAAVTPHLENLRQRVILISLDLQALPAAREISSARVGAVVRRPEAWVAAVLEDLRPDFVFLDHRYWSSKILHDWKAPWMWVAYTINDLPTAREYYCPGRVLIETDHLTALIEHSSTTGAGHERKESCP